MKRLYIMIQYINIPYSGIHIYIVSSIQIYRMHIQTNGKYILVNIFPRLLTLGSEFPVINANSQAYHLITKKK